MARARVLGGCYALAEHRTPTLGSGGLTLRWGIDPDGRVVDAAITRTSFDDAELEACVAREVRSLSFPRAEAPTRVEGFRLLFVAGAH
jgi:hypothetical protein